jgi:magnesium chelatase subunit D
VVTDGRATSGSDADLARATALLTGPGLAGTASVVVDCEASVLRLGLAERLAVQLGATLLGMDELEAGVARRLSRGPGQGKVA